MKKVRITTYALALGATLLCTSCEDQSPTAAADAPASASTADLDQISATALNEAVQKLLAAYPQVELAKTAPTIQKPIEQADGSQLILAQIPLVVRERLLKLENTPRVLNDLRKSSNEAINQSMRPDAGYLMQVGAPTAVLIDEDRQPKPLPPELNSMASKLKELAEESVYVITHEKDSPLMLEAKVRLIKSPNGVWVISSTDIDDRPLEVVKESTRASAQSNNFTIITPDWLEKRKAAISTLCEQFKQAAAPYIAQREEAARALLVTRIAGLEEQRRSVIEKATQKEEERMARKKTIADFLKDGSLYNGEWLRGSQFGKLSLQVVKSEILDDSIQFIGVIYDTDLPEARLDVAGRADLSQIDQTAPVTITIYDGQYDPDQPTAEVYDAKDGALVLSLNTHNKMEGIMTCTSWGKDSERNFTIKLSPSGGAALPTDASLPADEQPSKDKKAKKSNKKK